MWCSMDNRAKKKNLTALEQVAAGNELRLASFADVANIDFTKVYEKALEIFSDQAMLDKDPANISVRDLEISKAKANNFLDAIAGIIELSHQVDVIAAAKDNFKRSDELAVLNSLRRTCTLGAKGVEKLLRKSIQHMEYLESLEDAEVTVQDIAGLQTIINENVNTSQKLIASMSRLIQLERLSGNRPFGSGRSGTLSVGHLKEFGKEDPTAGAVGPRQLSKQEVAAMLEDEDDF